MRGLKQILTKEQCRLEELKEKAEERLKNAPEGTIRLSASRQYTQYYHCTNENKTGKYISRNDEALVHKLIQKAYDERILNLTERRMKQVGKLLREYEDDEIEQLFYKEHPKRRCCIQPIEQTWEQKLNEWKSKEYERKGFSENLAVIMTERGERVRSKSEKILADYFYRHGIEYKYECPLYLQGVGLIYPDFTFLSRKTGEVIYWEHNGRVDDPVYARRMVKKINAYEENGIYIGERLIVTFETEQTVLNTNKIEEYVERYL